MAQENRYYREYREIPDKELLPGACSPRYIRLINPRTINTHPDESAAPLTWIGYLYGRQSNHFPGTYYACRSVMHISCTIVDHVGFLVVRRNMGRFVSPGSSRPYRRAGYIDRVAQFDRSVFVVCGFGQTGGSGI